MPLLGDELRPVLRNIPIRKLSLAQSHHWTTPNALLALKVDIIDSRPNIKLEFKLRKEKMVEWQAFDMVAEGISLLSSKQSEWNRKIRQEGMVAVGKRTGTVSESADPL